MTGDAAIARELQQFHGIPPTFDVAFHLRELARVVVPALIAALVIAGSVFVIVNSQPGMYENTVTARIDPGESAASLNEVTVNALAPSFIALSRSQPLLQLALKRSGVRMTVDELAKNMTVDVKTSPSLVEVSVRAENAKDASALTQAVVEALDTVTVNLWLDKNKGDIERLQQTAGAVGAQMADARDPSPERDILKSEYDSVVDHTKELQKAQPNRIVLLSQSGVVSKVAPKPIQQSLVAFAVAFIVLAELLVFLNGRIGRRTNAAWMRRMAHKRGYALTKADAADATWPADTQIQLNRRQENGGAAIALYSADSLLAKSFAEAANSDGVAIPTEAIQSEWWRDPVNADRSMAVVVINVKDSGRAEFAAAFDRLDNYEIPVQLIALTSAGSRNAHGASDA